MSDLQEQFEKAAKDSKNIAVKPSNDDLLFLYAHYKQANEGNCTGKRPGMMDLVGRAKYDAWKKLEGMTKEDAMKKYIDKVHSLKGKI
ncbi:MAG: acyl-CoA-binding protein [Candidatus Brocadiae bacterium]|nr:acyl-CoA-binding protein [Candidatus Brocadiia bacterium]